jgi:hypothetical protein
MDARHEGDAMKKSSTAKRMASYPRGYWVVPKALMSHPDLSLEEKAVMMSIIYHWNEDQGKAWPSLGLIAKETALHKSTVSRVTGRLVEMGLLVKLAGEAKTKPSTEYQIVWKKYEQMMGLSDAQRIVSVLKRAGVTFALGKKGDLLLRPTEKLATQVGQNFEEILKITGLQKATNSSQEVA